MSDTIPSSGAAPGHPAVPCPQCLGPMGAAAEAAVPELTCPACEEKYHLHTAPGEAAPVVCAIKCRFRRL